MSRAYITVVGPQQEKHLAPAYAALVASSIELRRMTSNLEVMERAQPGASQARRSLPASRLLVTYPPLEKTQGQGTSSLTSGRHPNASVTHRFP
jgi:hypothetical protein